MTPQLANLERAESLPYASSLCGACYEVCPVKINIPEVLIYLRGKVVAKQQRAPTGKLHPEVVAMRWLARSFSKRASYERAQKLAWIGQQPLVHRGVITRLPGPLAGWTAVRDLRPVPRQSFHDWWRSREDKTRIQWSQTKNVWHNASIRSTLYLIRTPVPDR